ncbi:unnamed protein product, partial [Iphiclides podalirius]
MKHRELSERAVKTGATLAASKLFDGEGQLSGLTPTRLCGRVRRPATLLSAETVDEKTRRPTGRCKLNCFNCPAADREPAARASCQLERIPRRCVRLPISKSPVRRSECDFNFIRAAVTRGGAAASRSRVHVFICAYRVAFNMPGRLARLSIFANIAFRVSGDHSTPVEIDSRALLGGDGIRNKGDRIYLMSVSMELPV